MNNIISQILTEKEFAQIYSLALSTVRAWRVNGKGPRFLRLEKRGAIRYRMSDVLKWEEKNLFDSTSAYKAC